MAFVYQQERLVLRKGRPAQIEVLTDYQARQRALVLLQNNKVSPLARAVLGALAVGGVMTEGQLYRMTGVAGRTLRKYWGSRCRYLDRVPVPEEVATVLATEVLYCLGPVGRHLIEGSATLAMKGYLDERRAETTHDVFCAEVVARLLEALAAEGWRLRVLNRYEGAVRLDSGEVMIEPDSVLMGQRGEQVQAWVVEYHQEPMGSRVADKIARYEAVLSRAVETDRTTVWGEDVTVLAVWRHNAVGKAYQRELQRLKRGWCVGKSLDNLLTAEVPLTWHRFRDNQKVLLGGVDGT